LLSSFLLLQLLPRGEGRIGEAEGGGTAAGAAQPI